MGGGDVERGDAEPPVVDGTAPDRDNGTVDFHPGEHGTVMAAQQRGGSGRQLAATTVVIRRQPFGVRARVEPDARGAARARRFLDAAGEQVQPRDQHIGVVGTGPAAAAERSAQGVLGTVRGGTCGSWIRAGNPRCGVPGGDLGQHVVERAAQRPQRQRRVGPPGPPAVGAQQPAVGAGGDLLGPPAPRGRRLQRQHVTRGRAAPGGPRRHRIGRRRPDRSGSRSSARRRPERVSHRARPGRTGGYRSRRPDRGGRDERRRGAPSIRLPAQAAY